MARRKGPNAAILLARDKSNVCSAGPQRIEASQKATEDRADPSVNGVGSERRSAARNLAETAQAIRDTSEKVVDLAQKRSMSSRVDRGKDGDGNRYLRLVFPRDKQPDQVIDVSFLLGLPNLVEPVAEGLRSYVETLVARSRGDKISGFRRGLVAFLLQHRPNAKLEDIDRATLISYIKWQDSAAASAEGDAALSVATSRNLISKGRTVFQALQKYPQWGATATRILDDFPRRTHKGAEQHSQPRAILPREVLEAIHDAALQEIDEIRERLEEGERLLVEGRKLLESGCRDYRLLHVALAAMVERYPGVFPFGNELLKDDPPLGRWVFRGNHAYHRINRLARYRYASSRDLVPFVLLLAIEGAYNPETVLGLERAGVQVRTLFGVSVTQVEGPKGRAAGKRYAKDLDTEVVEPWLELLGRLTEPLRDSLAEQHRDHLFVFCSETSSSRAKSFWSDAGPSGEATWRSALANFRERHCLPHFTLAHIRPTLLDQVGQRHGALMAQRAGRHQSFQTTDGHYLGPGTAARERERLGETIQQMERFLGTDGKVDVRRSARSPGDDKGAATPGFACDDPYDSPIPGQRKRRLCRAYGMCPACPMATANPDDYHSVSQWLALGSAINRARENLDPQHWLSKWAPVAVRLVSLLEKVSDKVLAKARTLSIHLPPVG